VTALLLTIRLQIVVEVDRGETIFEIGSKFCATNDD